VSPPDEQVSQSCRGDGEAVGSLELAREPDRLVRPLRCLLELAELGALVTALEAPTTVERAA
jgi:hypothetical protein